MPYLDLMLEPLTAPFLHEWGKHTSIATNRMFNIFGQNYSNMYRFCLCVQMPGSRFQMDTTRSIVVIWVNIFQNESMGEIYIYSKSLV